LERSTTDKIQAALNVECEAFAASISTEIFSCCHVLQGWGNGRRFGDLPYNYSHGGYQAVSIYEAESPRKTKWVPSYDTATNL